MAKKAPRQLTPLQRAAIKHRLENGGSVSAAMRAVGYSDATAKNPSKLTKSKGYIKILEAAGATDERIAKKQSVLLDSAIIESRTFPAIRKEKRTTKGKNGKKLSKPITIIAWEHIPDEQIKAIIESVPGHKLLYIQKGTSEKVAHYQVPQSVVQSKQIEMALKVKGHFAADKLEIVDHELTPEEQKMYDDIMGKNKK